MSYSNTITCSHCNTKIKLIELNKISEFYTPSCPVCGNPLTLDDEMHAPIPNM